MTDQEVEVLLVEDNASDVELIMSGLKEHRHVDRIEVVTDGEEALDFIFAHGAFASRRGENTPKVILLDLQLPKVCGLEVLCIVKTNPRTKAIPVVVLTSSSEEKDIIESYQLGVNSYIVKPVDFEKFMTAVDQVGL